MVDQNPSSLQLMVRPRRTRPNRGGFFSSASRTMGHVSAPGRGGTFVENPPGEQAISYLDPTAEVMPVSRKTR